MRMNLGLRLSIADFDVINQKFEEVEWAELRDSCSFEEYHEVLTNTLFLFFESLVPPKKFPSGRPKHLNALSR